MSQNLLRMPRLSDSMSEATIVAWLKQPGELFLRGQPLLEVETDKATVEYEAEADGMLAEILVPEGGGRRSESRSRGWLGRMARTRRRPPAKIRPPSRSSPSVRRQRPRPRPCPRALAPRAASARDAGRA